MDEKKSDAVSSRALHVLALGGPVAVASATLGAALVGYGVSGRPNQHSDAWVVVGGILVILGYLEWAMARRFAAHEVVEFRQYERVASIADDAAMAAMMMTKATREQVAAVEEFRLQSDLYRRSVEELSDRVRRIEDRVLRAAFVPGAARKPEGPT